MEVKEASRFAHESDNMLLHAEVFTVRANDRADAVIEIGEAGDSDLQHWDAAVHPVLLG